MEQNVSWITQIVNHVLGGAALALLHALHIQPDHPELPIPEHVAMGILVLIVGTLLALLVRSRLSVENPGATQQIAELLLTNRVLDAQQALDWGLVNQVVDDERLAESAAALAARLAAGPVGAFGGVKRLLAEAEPAFEAQLARESLSISARGTTAEGREGIAAFLEKRTPRFSGPSRD